jgi:acid phosphatase (class A)
MAFAPNGVTLKIPRVLACGIFLGLLGCGNSSETPPKTPVSVSAHQKPQGYLVLEKIPVGKDILAPPPLPGSAEFAEDETSYHKTGLLKQTPRWQQAALDADISFPRAATVFSCATGKTLSKETTPHLYLVLERSTQDVLRIVSEAKKKYPKDRPFEIYKEPTCIPEQEPALKSSGAYPSGHAALGQVWGDLFSDLVPEKEAAIHRRAYEFGQSRVVCRVHFQSDVDAGRLLGTIIYARLKANPEFALDFKKVKVELERAPAFLENCP